MIHKYKMNDLNIVLDVNGGSIHVVDDLTYDVLDHYKDKNLDEIKELFSKEKPEEVESIYGEIQDMEKEGLLFVSDDYMDFKEFQERDHVIKAMCLHVVHDCNLKCEYCFASQGDFGGHKAYMTEEVGRKAIDFILDRSGNRKNLEVDFFGGEPLMDFELVKNLVDYGHKKAAEKGKNFRFTITTNGVLLDDETIDYINEHMHNVVLSLDGRKEVNDSLRRTLNDKGSYDVIVPKYQKLIEGRGDKAYYVRGTFTKKNLDFSEDVKHFKDLGFNLSSIEPVVDADENEYAITEEDLDQIMEEYEKMAIQYAEDHVKGDPFTFFHFTIDLNQGPCVIKRVQGCGAGCEYIAITPEGDLYPCHQFVGNEDFKMGNLLEEDLELPEEITQPFRDAHVFSKDKCKDCWAKFYCSGGCHANAYNFNGDLQVPYEVGCEMQRKRTECAIMIEVVKKMREVNV